MEEEEYLDIVELKKVGGSTARLPAAVHHSP